MTALTDVSQAYLASSFADQAIKPPVRLVATVNIVPSGIGQTIDGAVTQLGDRILLTAQTDARQNGVKVVSDGIWPVPGDFSNLVQGTLFTATAGVSNSGQYSLTTANPIILGVTSLTFTTSIVGGLAAETAARISADNTLQGNINAEASTRASADSAEATARTSADTTLQTNINTEITNRTAAVSAEASARTTADALIVSNLAAANGAADVGFTPSGTGAVTHSVGSVLGRTINIFDKMSDAMIADVQGAAVLDHTAFVQAAVDQAKANGQRLVAPYGTYNLTAWNLNDITRGLEILGESDPYNAPVGGCTYFRYTGAGAGSPFTALSSFGINFRNCRIGYNNASFTGDLFSTGWSSANLDVQDLNFEHVRFSGESSGINANSLLKLDKTIISTIGDGCGFELANNGIVSGANYINVLKVGRVVFANLNSKAVLLGSSTYQTIKFDTAVFEAAANGKSCGFDMGAGLVEGLSFEDCWFGDVTVNGGGPWIHAIASGLRVMGGFMGTAGAGATDYSIQPDNCDGVDIGGGIRFDNRALNIPTASRVINLVGAHVPLGSTAIQNASATPINIVACPGLADTYAGVVSIGSTTTPKVKYTPSSGSTKVGYHGQNGDTLFWGEDGVANGMSMAIATGQFYPAQDNRTAQTAAGLFAGTGVPSNSNGNNGDFYFRGDGTQAGNTVIYHKQAGAWVALITT